MGTLIPFCPDPYQSAHEAEVRHVCALARCEDLVPQYLAAHTPIEIVVEQCLWLVLRRKPPSMLARQIARMHGPAGTRRRALTPSPNLYRRA
ncbi:hypothetical protein P7D22_04730 [Lichenihabitans sp. Uapishka_5]|uniref:hypothetical protein n=1 Tax=Lichenihabitans sp. Uapishka_5 TaxID=3037302 RepID=UPI0029E8238C|nr:hypothetical protein [Lichenihabitans sp. Uapishka_5]MDX7950484.1 hypothetical protein [Lichenihabitans sp. Uapishka_5]